MTQRFRRRYLLPLTPFVVLLLVMIAGGLLNSVDAHGKVVDDTNGSPLANIPIQYGSRTTVTGADGSYVMNDLPRGARLVERAPNYVVSSMSADSRGVRLVPLTITFEAKDATTQKGIDTPEARQPATVRIGQGTSSGEIVVGPYPDRQQAVIICAKGYTSKDVTAAGTKMTVYLQSGGTGCPPLPSSPPPAQVPSPSPSTSGAPGPSATPTPTATP